MSSTHEVDVARSSLAFLLAPCYHFLSVHISVYLSLYLSIYLFVIYLSTYPSNLSPSACSLNNVSPTDHLLSTFLPLLFLFLLFPSLSMASRECQDGPLFRLLTFLSVIKAKHISKQVQGSGIHLSVNTRTNTTMQGIYARTFVLSSRSIFTYCVSFDQGVYACLWMKLMSHNQGFSFTHEQC